MRNALMVVVMATVILIASFGFRKIGTSPFVQNQALTDTLHIHDTLSLQVPEWKVLYDSLQLATLGLSDETFRYAWYGFQNMKLQKPIMAIADFSQSSRNKRLYVIDAVNKKLILNTYVAHGRNSGQEFAQKFSNENSSYQSSLGFYRTLSTYQGKHGLSLRLEGQEKGVNDRALERAIVMHGADYVSENFIRNTGRLGRSLGCPAVSMAEHERLIKLLTGGAGLFLYYPDATYLRASQLLAGLVNTQNTAL
ncbi:hypothetical protein GCM10027275_20750 [Rhabdobacter roseus]|uniref:Murein L,D-transpeptidase catalytic domain family protein n=1 Tax=Rhabdobacter roseus TaxID=1655419 RepID=A0A840TV84_9BACT|nr:murein L,D-transpeptidase catalytic domain family protein [Rhabdobacter roseus]MBB5284008.1 hypothetical protein [Rhabdobacter roseus]